MGLDGLGLFTWLEVEFGVDDSLNEFLILSIVVESVEFSSHS